MVLAVLAALATADDPTIAPPLSGAMGPFKGVESDTTVKVQNSALSPLCTLWRDQIKSYEYVTEHSSEIFYRTEQCKQSAEVVVYQRMYFSYFLAGPWLPLPEGCAPPTLEPPAKPSPCVLASRAGARLAQTIARLIVPVLMRDAVDNPLKDDSALVAFLAVAGELRQTFPQLYTTEQQQVVADLREAILPIATAKWKCILDIVLPGGVDKIRSVCLKDGFTKAIEGAIKGVAAEQLSCGQVGCSTLVVTPSPSTPPTTPTTSSVDIMTPVDGETYYIFSYSQPVVLE